MSERWYAFTGQTPETGLGLKEWLEAVHRRTTVLGPERTILDASARGEALVSNIRLRREDGVYRLEIDAAQPRFESERRSLLAISVPSSTSPAQEAEEANWRASEERGPQASSGTPACPLLEEDFRPRSRLGSTRCARKVWRDRGAHLDASPELVRELLDAVVLATVNQFTSSVIGGRQSDVALRSAVANFPARVRAVFVAELEGASGRASSFVASRAVGTAAGRCFDALFTIVFRWGRATHAGQCRRHHRSR